MNKSTKLPTVVRLGLSLMLLTTTIQPVLAQDEPAAVTVVEQPMASADLAAQPVWLPFTAPAAETGPEPASAEFAAPQGEGDGLSTINTLDVVEPGTMSEYALTDEDRVEQPTSDVEQSVPLNKRLFLPLVQGGEENDVAAATDESAASPLANPQARGDFNGDGYSDLAVGVPFEDFANVPNSGLIQVIYGSAVGLTSTNNAMFGQSTLTDRNSAELNDWFGQVLAAADFNADGYDDLAIGVPQEDWGSSSFLVQRDAGVVEILYGTANGLTSANRQIWHQDSLFIADKVESGDQFGAALATGDFNLDGFADLAIGVPREDLDSLTDAGVVHVLHGSAAGISATGSQMWHQNVTGMIEEAESAEFFGSALAAGNFDGKDGDDLVIGVPAETIGKIKAGGVNIIFAQPGQGLGYNRNGLISQDMAGIIGVAETGDRLGASLAAGNFNGDAYADLAVGAPGETLEGTTDIRGAGAVNVIYGASTGLTAVGNQVWTQDSPGIYDRAEGSDNFGSVLATGDFTKDGRDDLVVGVPVESFLTALDGIVHLINGGPDGLTAVGNQLYRPDMPGTGATQTGAQFFGQRLFVGDFDGNGQADLGIGIPFKNVNGVMAAGAVLVVYHNGLAFSAHLWHQGMPGFLELPEELDQFGY